MKFINQIEPVVGKKEKMAMNRYFESGGWLTEFKKTEELENQIAGFLKSRYAVLVNNGTIALALALMALGVKNGDEVIVPDFTMIATANAVKLTGAEPVFSEIEEKNFCLDIDKVKISPKTKALIYVSLNGRCGDINKIIHFCRSKKIHFIEDACQAFGSKYQNKFLGTFGEIGCFSFSPHKIITTGQGGAIVTDDSDIYKKLKLLKDFGREKAGVDWHLELGFNFKFTDLQAIIGIAQLSNIKKRLLKKKKNFKLYGKHLRNMPEVKFPATDFKNTSPWFVDILVPPERRDDLINYLKINNIGSRPFYPSLHVQPVYKYKNEKFAISKKVSESGVWLPSSLSLNEQEIKHITKVIKNFFKK